MDEFNETNKLRIKLRPAINLDHLDGIGGRQLYKTTSIKRGVVKIINLINTASWNRSNFAKLDETHLYQLFSLMGFHVSIRLKTGDSHTRENILNALKSFAEDQEILDYDIFILIIIGENICNSLYCQCGNGLEYDEVQNIFELEGDKPTLIIFDTYGENEINGISHDVIDEHNLIVVNSLMPHNIGKNSFVRNLCKEFMESAHNQDLTTMLKNISRALETPIEISEGKKLFFNPGFYLDGELPTIQDDWKVDDDDGISRLRYEEFYSVCTCVDLNLHISHSCDVNARDFNGWTTLHYAASSGNLKAVQYFLNHGADKYLTTNSNSTALHLAILGGHVEVCKVLLENEEGIDQKYTNSKGETLTHLASQHGYIDIADFLITKGVDITMTNKDNWSPLHFAAIKGKADMVQFLIDYDIDTKALTNRKEEALHLAVVEGQHGVCEELLKIAESSQDIVSKGGTTLLQLAVQHGRLAIVKLLLEKGVDINGVNWIGWTALHFAVSRKCFEIVKYLVGEGANKDIKTKHDNTALHFAVQLGYVEICHFLLQNMKPFEINNLGMVLLHLATQKGHIEVAKLFYNYVPKEQTDKNGMTALHIAASYGHTNMVHFLLDEGWSKFKFDRDYFMPIHHAVKNGHLDVCKILFNDKFDVNKKYNRINRFTLLQLASQNGHTHVADYLLTKGVCIDTPSIKNWTALHYAAFNNNLDTVKLLIDRKADKYAKTNKENTPLHMAIQRGHFEICKQLLANENDLINKQEYERGDGITLLHLSARYDHTEIAELLLSRNVDLEATNKKGWTALHYAAFNGNLEMVKYLNGKGANQKVKTQQNCTALGLAVGHGYLDVCEELLRNEQSIDQDHKRNDGKTLLHLAAQKGYEEIVKLLLDKKVDINLKCENGKTALHFSTIQGHQDVVGLLITHNPDKYAVDKTNFTPLHYAIKLDQFECCKKLLQDEIDINVNYKNNLLQLWLLALNKKDMNIAKLLLNNGINTNITDENNCTALHHAVMKTHVELIRLLLEHNADKAIIDKCNYIPLHYAVLLGNLDSCKLLFADEENNGNYNKQQYMELLLTVFKNKNQEIVKYLISKNNGLPSALLASASTLLHDAVKIKDDLQNLVSLLVTSVDKYAKDFQSFTALHYAIKLNMLEYCKILLHEESNIDGNYMIDGKTLLQFAFTSGHLEIIKYILSLEIDVNLPDRDGKTALHYAVEYINLDIVKVLIAKGADKYAADNIRCSPLHYAVRMENVEMYQELC